MGMLGLPICYGNVMLQPESASKGKTTLEGLKLMAALVLLIPNPKAIVFRFGKLNNTTTLALQ